MFAPKFFYGRYFAPRYWAVSGQSEGRFEQLDDLDVARPLGAIPERVNYLMAQAETKDVRYRMDGIAPTAGIGLIIYAGDPPTRLAGSIQLLKFIEVAASAKLNVHYY